MFDLYRLRRKPLQDLTVAESMYIQFSRWMQEARESAQKAKMVRDNPHAREMWINQVEYERARFSGLWFGMSTHLIFRDHYVYLVLDEHVTAWLNELNFLSQYYVYDISFGELDKETRQCHINNIIC